VGWVNAVNGSLASHGLVFVGGLVSGFSPCVLPTVALVIAYVGGYGRGRLRALWLSLGFVSGFSLTLAAAGYLAALVGRAAGAVTLMTFLASGLCLIMGLALLEVLPIELPGIQLPRGRYLDGFLGAFVLG